jgi:copper homeostasis protein
MIGLEICCTSLDEALIAQHCGATRIELCHDLSVGGLTPDKTLFQAVQAQLTIPIHVLIRHRAGDFVFAESEQDSLIESIQLFRTLGAQGIVIGALTATHEIDYIACQKFKKAANDCVFVFHKAFDETIDPFHALSQLITLGFDGILTAGRTGTAIANAEFLAALQQYNKNRLFIMPGGSIRSEHISHLHQQVRATYYHSAANAAAGLSALEEEVKNLKLQINSFSF